MASVWGSDPHGLYASQRHMAWIAGGSCLVCKQQQLAALNPQSNMPLACGVCCCWLPVPGVSLAAVLADATPSFVSLQQTDAMLLGAVSPCAG